MQTIALNSKTKMPVLGLGTWRSPRNKAHDAVLYALEKANYIHIDCAYAYDNEAEIGKAFSKVFVSPAKRKKVFITGKLWNTFHHPKNVERNCRQTLKDLQLNYLDLYIIHWGVPMAPGREARPVDKDGVAVTEKVSIQQTWQAMEKLVKKGLVKSIGVSNFTTMMLFDLLTYAKIPPAVNQVELHPFNSQQGLVDFCHYHNIAVTAYSPLGSPGNFDQKDFDLLNNSTIKKIAKRHKKTPAQVLIRWTIQRNTIVIPKSVTPKRIKENIDVFDFKLTKEDTKAINKLNQNHRFINPKDWWGIPYFD